MNGNDQTLINLLTYSAQELNVILSRITNVLGENQNLSAEILNKEIDRSTNI